MALSPNVSPGRPRDPDVDRRIVDAAFLVLAEDGWSGFSFEAVARRAGVSKASIYLRWPSKGALVDQALQEHVVDVVDANTGSLRGDLAHLAAQLFRLHTNPDLAFLRVALDGRRSPELAEHLARVSRSQRSAARAMVRRSITREELASETSVTLILDLLNGAVLSRVLSTPPRLRPRLLARVPAFVNDIVEVIVTGSQRAVPTSSTLSDPE